MGGLTPFVRGILALFAALADAFALPILRGDQNTILLQQVGRGFDSLPLYAKPVNPADDIGSFVVDDPFPGLSGSFL